MLPSWFPGAPRRYRPAEPPRGAGEVQAQVEAFGTGKEELMGLIAEFVGWYPGWERGAPSPGAHAWCASLLLALHPALPSHHTCTVLR